MSGLQNIDLDLDIFYKKDNLPKISVGDKIKVVIYLELPKEIGEKEKKEKERTQAFEGVVISKHLSNQKIDIDPKNHDPQNL
jgi:ribosomal protein L19